MNTQIINPPGPVPMEKPQKVFFLFVQIIALWFKYHIPGGGILLQRHVIACWERADLLALLCVVFSCILSLSHMASQVSCGT